jgi:predicted S18 family serine protease
MKKYLILLFIIILFSIDVSAYKSSGQIGLLTVSESANGTIQKGGTAELYLAIKPGTGRIFIDSFPLSKLDTQITMRFASETACDFLNMDCSIYDFFYTIHASSAIVGGPSAGAAATVLTTAMLDDQNIDESIIMTGTINSGYLVGPVAGISAKTLAAQYKGYKKVLIPKWDLANDTLDKNLTIPIVIISDLEGALYEFTGKNYSRPYDGVYTTDNYDSIMRNVTSQLCSKYGSIFGGKVLMPNLTQIIPGYDDIIEDYPINANDNLTIDGNSIGGNSVDNTSINYVSDNLSIDTMSGPKDYFQLALSAIEQKQYYSAASFCFGGNVRITRELMKNYDNKKLKTEYAKLLGDIGVFENYLDEKSLNLSTISELETYMVVKERLDDSKKILSNQDLDNISSEDLAYAIERFETAKVWTNFFTLPAKEFVLDENALSVACSKKIEETEERINYLQAYYPRDIDRTDLSLAYNYRDSEDYALCIFTASKAKADVDVILGVLFVPESDLGDLLDEKLVAAEKAIVHQESAGVFPILGYSYYEYSMTLKDTDTYSALLYAEYGLELSNLDMYFPMKKESHLIHWSDFFDIPFAIFFLGFSIGILFVVFLGYTVYMTNRKKSDTKSDVKKTYIKKRVRR